MATIRVCLAAIPAVVRGDIGMVLRRHEHSRLVSPEVGHEAQNALKVRFDRRSTRSTELGSCAASASSPYREDHLNVRASSRHTASDCAHLTFDTTNRAVREEEGNPWCERVSPVGHHIRCGDYPPTDSTWLTPTAHGLAGVRQVSVLSVGRIFAAAISAVWFVLAARNMSVRSFGSLALLLSIGMVTAFLGDLGLSGLLSNVVGHRPDVARSAVAAVLVRRVPLSILASFVTMAAYVLAGGIGGWWIAVAFAPSLIATACHGTVTTALRSLGDVRFDAGNEVCSRVFVLAIGALVLAGGGGLVAVVLVYVVADVASAIVLAALFVRRTKFATPDHRPRRRVKYAAARNLGVSGVINTLYFRIDLWLVALFDGDKTVGRYRGRIPTVRGHAATGDRNRRVEHPAHRRPAWEFAAARAAAPRLDVRSDHGADRARNPGLCAVAHLDPVRREVSGRSSHASPLVARRVLHRGDRSRPSASSRCGRARWPWRWACGSRSTSAETSWPSLHSAQIGQPR